MLVWIYIHMCAYKNKIKAMQHKFHEQICFETASQTIKAQMFQGLHVKILNCK